jgi:hypothetical protein
MSSRSANTSNCSWPTAASTGAGRPVGVAQHLHHALLVELGDALAELLELAGVERPGDPNTSGAKRGMAGTHRLGPS